MKLSSKLLSTALVIAPIISASAQDFTISNLVDYYSNIPAGQYIKPNLTNLSLTNDSAFEKFEKTFPNAFTPTSKRKFDHEFTQDLFTLDVEQFNQSQNGADFLDAKIKFYSKLEFDKKIQRNTAPYTYMNGWLSLNHPPVKKITLPLEKYTQTFSPQNPRPIQSEYFSPDFQAKLDKETGTELTFGNRLHTLFNNDAIKEKIRLVKDAKRYIFGAVMATVCDASSEEFVQALIDKAQSGVRVTLIMEKFYMGIVFRGCTNRLRRGGVDVVLATDKLKLHSFLSFFHAKFWVRDGEEAIVGGQNIMEFENLSTGFNQLNRDTDLLVQGPAATDFVNEYLTLWENHQKGRNQSLDAYRDEVAKEKELQRITHQRGAELYEQKLNDPSTRMAGACRVLVQGPYNRNLSYGDTLTKLASVSQHSIISTTPELDFETEEKKKFNELTHFIQEIKAAALRGSKVEVISNGVDGGNGELNAFMRKMMMKDYAKGKYRTYRFWRDWSEKISRKNASKKREFYHDLQKTPNVRSWAHFNYMHAKQTYFDRIVSSISSMNFDLASFSRNTEAGIICMDENLSKEMEDQLALDLVNSTPIASSNEDAELNEEEELSLQN
jgi:phosphatidylserine/phosphatidylglycerophosphate/cardiolipin synthase-like enzyme